MRKLFFLASLVVPLSAAEADGPVWAGPGWYQFEYSPGGYRLIAGPFRSFNACWDTLPDDQEEQEYDCANYGEKPSGPMWWGPDYPGR